MFFTTAVILPVSCRQADVSTLDLVRAQSLKCVLTWRMVTAVSTRELTASILLLNLSKLSASFFFLIAFDA